MRTVRIRLPGLTLIILPCCVPWECFPVQWWDKRVMLATLEKVLDSWMFEHMWGWDFPVMAMTAARLGKPDTAIDILLMDSPKILIFQMGITSRGDKSDLPLYLPGTGTAYCCCHDAAGWDGMDSNQSVPGFPGMGNGKLNGKESIQCRKSNCC